MKKIVYIMAFAALWLAGCSGQYKGLPRVEVLDYQTRPTYGSLHAMATAYAESINAAVKEDTLHPGMYADYAVVLALMGHEGTACRMFNAEMRAFPESRPMVMRVKQRMLPAMMNDTMANQYDTADLQQLARWAYDSVQALRPLPPIAAVIDSTDTEWLRRQTPVDSVNTPIRLTANQKREMLYEEQTAAKRRQQAIADSVAASKQAKLDARKQAKLEKQKEKKDKEKSKREAEKLKKKEQREKDKAKQQEAAAKEKVRKERMAERERAKKEQAAERERVKKEQAAERERVKKEQVAERERQRQERAAERQQAKKTQKGGEE